MTEQTINELTNFFQKFGKEEAKQPAQSNLLFDYAVKYFFSNIEERGLAEPTKHFYKDNLNEFRKFLVQIKKVQCLEKLTGEEIKFYIESKYSKHKTNTFNCHARALRAFFNYLERDGYLIANPARNIKPKKVRKEIGVGKAVLLFLAFNINNPNYLNIYLLNHQIFLLGYHYVFDHSYQVYLTIFDDFLLFHLLLYS